MTTREGRLTEVAQKGSLHKSIVQQAIVKAIRTLHGLHLAANEQSKRGRRFAMEIYIVAQQQRSRRRQSRIKLIRQSLTSLFPNSSMPLRLRFAVDPGGEHSHYFNIGEPNTAPNSTRHNRSPRKGISLHLRNRTLNAPATNMGRENPALPAAEKGNNPSNLNSRVIDNNTQVENNAEPSENVKLLGKVIKRLRKQVGKSHQELATATHVKATWIKRLEDGLVTRNEIDDILLEALAHQLQVDVLPLSIVANLVGKPDEFGDPEDPALVR